MSRVEHVQTIRAALLRARIEESIRVRLRLLEDSLLAGVVDGVVEAMVTAIRSGGKVLLCGNGGSAADAQHLAAELVGRFCLDRQPFPAIGLADNVAALTAISNDFSYDEAYARGVRAFGKPGDVLIGLSTSGSSRNVVAALETANELGLVTVAFIGAPGSALDEAAQHSLTIPASTTAAIQEAHKLLGHVVFELVEAALCAA